MTQIDRQAATPPPRNTTPLPTGAPVPEKPAKRATDAISISIDARARLGKDNQPEVVVEGMTVDGGGVADQVEARAKGHAAGVRNQITQQVVAAIAEQVAKAIEPVLEAKLASCLAEEHLPPQLAHELALKTMPQIAQAVAQQLARQVKLTTR
jgi:hypothetical protein